MKRFYVPILMLGVSVSDSLPLRLFLVAIAILLFQHTLDAAETNETATITVLKVDKLVEKVTGAVPEIYIDGPLDNTTLTKLKDVIVDYQIDGASVFLNSPGGNLMAGIDIGRQIRAHGWSTFVGTIGQEYNKARPGYCYSSCVFAYIGGYFRYSERGSVLGVHRFSKTTTENDDLDTAQVISALLTNYIKEMGIDNGLFERMVRAGSDEIIILSDDDARALGVINDGILPAQWSFENSGHYIYLIGQQQTSVGIGKIAFICENHSLVAIAMYQSGENASLISETTTHYSLRIDDDFIQVKLHDRPQISVNTFVYASFTPTRDQLQRISTANKIGFAFHPVNPALFYGFLIDMDHGHGKIISMIENCSMESKSAKLWE